jgi:hypothetical protein
MALLAGCAPGLTGGDRTTDPALDRILVSDANVPAKQGLAFMALQYAVVARHRGGFALAAAVPADAYADLSNRLNAIVPAFPATPTVTASGLTPFWPPAGYGLRNSMQDIAAEMGRVGSRYEGRAAVAAQVRQVTVCAEETLERVDRLVSLSQQALDAGSADELAPLLQEIDRLAQIVLEAPAAESADACSLEDAKKDLQTLALQIA